MIIDYKKITRQIYNEKLKKFGHSPKSLGWLNGRQAIRFSALTSIGNMNKKRILDLGCGFGDLYLFLKKNHILFSYLGIDINPKIIQIAKKKYPHAKFLTCDIRNENFEGMFDYVIISGVFNHSKTTSYKFIENVLSKAFHHCKKGVAVDFISNYVDHKTRHTFYASPEKIFQISKKLTKSVALRSDYMPFEFAMFLFKNDKILKNNVFREFNESIDRKFRTNKWLKLSS